MKIKFSRSCRLGDTEVTINVKTSVSMPIQEYQISEIASTVIKEFAEGIRRMNAETLDALAQKEKAT